MRRPRTRNTTRRLPLAASQVACLLALALMLPASSAARSFSGPTYSSPISLSADGRLVWFVNPGADTGRR